MSKSSGFGCLILLIVIVVLLALSRVFRWLLIVAAVLVAVIVVISVVRYTKNDAKKNPEKKAFKKFSDSVFNNIPEKKKTWEEKKALRSIWFAKSVVTEHSKRYAALVRLNNQYAEYAHNIYECLPLHFSSVKEFSEFNPDQQMANYVLDNSDHYNVMLARINECRRMIDEYKRKYYEILQSKAEIPYPFPSGITEASYLKKENDVITHPAMRLDFDLDIDIDIYVIMAWEHTTKPEKKHYVNTKTYRSADIRNMLAQAGIASTNTNQNSATNNNNATDTSSSAQKQGSNNAPGVAPEEFISSEGVTTLEGAIDLLSKNYERKPEFKKDIKYLLDQTIAFQRGANIAIEYIDKRFPKPQITNDKFMGSINDWENAFIGIICKASDTIAISTRHNKKIDEYLEHIKYGALALSVKVEELSVVLVNGNEKMDGYETTEQIEALVNEMQKLIKEAKKYE